MELPNGYLPLDCVQVEMIIFFSKKRKKIDHMQCMHELHFVNIVIYLSSTLSILPFLLDVEQ